MREKRALTLALPLLTLPLLVRPRRTGEAARVDPGFISLTLQTIKPWRQYYARAPNATIETGRLENTRAIYRTLTEPESALIVIEDSTSKTIPMPYVKRVGAHWDISNCNLDVWPPREEWLFRVPPGEYKLTVHLKSKSGVEYTTPFKLVVKQ